jgi:periplasmic divalent cation tolerance protein
MMKPARNYFLVLVTAPNLATARELAQAALEARLVACANLVPKIESHYWWQGKLEQSSEILLLLKTTRRRLAALERCIMKRHPYDTAEVLAVPLASGSQRYLTWMTEAVSK